MLQIYRQLIELLDKGQTCALATLVSASGSSPQNAGAKLIVMPDGQLRGTIGGGCMEAETRQVALDCLRKNRHNLFKLQLDDDFGWDDGLICGGSVQIFVDPHPERNVEAYRQAIQSAGLRKTTALCYPVAGVPDEQIGLAALRTPTDVEIPSSPKVVSVEEGGAQPLSLYVEPILPRPTALIAGAGHIGQALAQVLSLCGFEVIVIDDRPSFANRDRLPFADRVEVVDIPEFLRGYPIDDSTYIAIVTRGHRHDAHSLRECIHSNAKYLGMIGSKRKIHVIFEEFVQEGVASIEELRRVRSPMGLTLNDREVGEIAVSIAAEMIAVRNGADLARIGPMQYTPPFVKETNSGVTN